MTTDTSALTSWHTVAWTTLGELTLVRDAGGLRGLGDVTAQEVGAAVGRNPLCIVVPCHRVVGAGGRLTGYAGGLARKRLLLDLEQVPRSTGTVGESSGRPHGTSRRSVYPS